jgi:hypothetical protein
MPYLSLSACWFSEYAAKNAPELVGVGSGLRGGPGRDPTPAAPLKRKCCRRRNRQQLKSQSQADAAATIAWSLSPRPLLAGD